jgi:tRNA pseudouridine38-40 synthase
MTETQHTEPTAQDGNSTPAPIRLRVDLAYVGTGFHGWQEQAAPLRTVQGELRVCLERLLGHGGGLTGAGRTDTGVHARGQVCHLTVRGPREANRVLRALAAVVPEDIEIEKVRRVSHHFNARYSATARRYSYHLQFQRDLFRPYAHYVPWTLDRSAMDQAAQQLLGRHDFTSFCKKTSLRRNNDCQIDVCRFDWRDDSAIFHVRANRFLHNMVRNMVGTLLDVGTGVRAPEAIASILTACDRSRAGRTAPARGLFLEEVIYPIECDDPDFRPSEGELP